MLKNYTYNDMPGEYYGSWSVPYYSCAAGKWLLSYSVFVPILDTQKYFENQIFELFSFNSDNFSSG